MSILFAQTPANAKANNVFIELDKNKRKLGLQVVPQVVVVTGLMDSAVTAVSVGDQVQLFDPDQAGQNFGFGSEIHAMTRRMLLGQSAFPVTVIAIPLLEDVADVVAAGTITISITTVVAGTMNLYIAGDLVQITVVTADTDATIAAKIAAAITANPDLVVEAADTLAVVDITAKWKGSTGDDITIAFNLQGEELPGGVSAVIVAMTGGTGEADIDGALNGIAESDIVTHIAHPFIDTTNLGKIEAYELIRWAPGVKKGFIAFTAIRGTEATAKALTITRNSFVSSIIGIQDTPQMASQVSAAIAAADAFSAAADPVLQLHTVQLPGFIPPTKANEWSYTERDDAVKNGCSTIKNIAGAVVIDQLVNTFQTTGSGGTAQDVDRQVTTVTLLTAIIYDQDQYFTAQWARAKLANDSDSLPTGQKIMTPNVMQAELISRYDLYLARAWVEDRDGYIENLNIERNTTNPERIDVEQTIFRIGNLRITALKIDYDFATL